jgi:hypothetical protein
MSPLPGERTVGRGFGCRSYQVAEVSQLRGVRYVVDDRGNKKAVVLDLRAWGRLREDSQDVLISEARKGERGIPWDTLKAEMRREAEHTGQMPSCTSEHCKGQSPIACPIVLL